jgi:hypothetical protein
MTTKEYVVALKEGVDYDSFWQEMETSGVGSSTIPTREVDIVNDRVLNPRACHYSLTDEEAETLRNDPRVYCVEIPPGQRTDTKPVPFASQSGLYYKGPNTGRNPNNNNGVNWGLFRLNSTTNNTVGNSGTLTFDYPLDGSGVDFVIQDSGLQVDHPEFTDANGVSRVQKIDWWAAAGQTGNPPWFPDIGEFNMPVGFYTDTSGHGTHCAGTAVGKTYGRAKNARIYVMKVAGLGGAGGVQPEYVFDLITAWHSLKPVDPVTGYKRPTVVNMSWGYISAFIGITGGNYQGTTPWTGTTKQPQYGMQGGNATGFPANTVYGNQINLVDSDVSQMLAAGVILCGAAGNYFQTIDVPGGPNYNTYYDSSFYGPLRYYMRGGSPGCSPGVICVGNVWTGDPSLGFAEQKANDSESGPRVDIWAPGTSIISSVPNINEYGCTTLYPLNTSYLIGSLSGTSMATPQVAGLCAQLLQLYPTATPAQIRQKIIDLSTPGVLFDTGVPDDYSVPFTLHGGPNRYAYQPFNSATNFAVSNSITLSNITLVNT